MVSVSLGKQTSSNVTNRSNIALSLRGYAHLPQWVMRSRS